MNGSDWREHAERLADYLVGEGLDRRWAAVFAAVPRHVFVADGHTVGSGDAVVWDRQELLRQAYADQVVVTRSKSEGGEHVATSSASQPAIVAIMLRLLDLADGASVLEIGTGPGYNACLLCARVGDGNVTSVDIQDDVVDEARERLAGLGFRPHLETGDGSLGCPAQAPFDRVIATCGLSRIPRAWLGQLAPGARIVAPMNFGGALAVLDRREDGGLSGRFPIEAGFFMVLRRPGEQIESEPPGHLSAPPRVLTADVDLEDLGDLDFRLWLELSLPGAQMRPLRDADRNTVQVDITTSDSKLEARDTDGIRITEYGEPLWAKVNEALRQWIAHDRPIRTRLGMTVTPDRQWVWLDAEDADVNWRI